MIDGYELPRVVKLGVLDYSVTLERSERAELWMRVYGNEIKFAVRPLPMQFNREWPKWYSSLPAAYDVYATIDVTSA